MLKPGGPVQSSILTKSYGGQSFSKSGKLTKDDLKTTNLDIDYVLNKLEADI